MVSTKNVIELNKKEEPDKEWYSLIFTTDAD